MRVGPRGAAVKARCRLCGEEVVLKSVPPGSVWTTLAEDPVCERGTIGHEPMSVCSTEWCEDYGEPVADALGLNCPECGLPPAVTAIVGEQP